MARRRGGNEDLLERLTSGFVLADGAMGTMLSAGGGQWSVPEELNLREPERVQRVHAAYVAAGAELIETNSLGGTTAKLSLVGLEERAAEINRAAAEIARAAAGDAAWVAGSIGSTGQFLEPLGELTAADAEEMFLRCAESLAEGGADLFIVETMTSVDEARAAVRGACRTGLPVICTMTFEPNGRTIMGDTLEGLLSLVDDGAVAVGLNCGQGPDTMAAMVAQLREMAPCALLAAQPNAGIPRYSDGTTVYDVTPAQLAEFAVEMRRLKVNLIGACCGSSPEHISKMALALRKR